MNRNLIKGVRLVSLPSKPAPLWNPSDFKKLPLDFRVGAIISDGQWYSPDKICKLIGEQGTDAAIHRVKTVLDEMADNGAVRKHDNGQSYCMSLEQMKTWRTDNDIPVNAQPISKIVAPRVFGSRKHRLTENEFFAEAPLHQIGTVTFYLKDPSMFDTMRDELGWLGKFIVVPNPMGNKFKLECLSASIAKKKLIQYHEEHGGDVLTDACTAYNTSIKRELCELDKDALADLIEYYVAFIPSSLVTWVGKTFKKYISRESDGDLTAESRSILCQWVVDFIRQYNEAMGRPFSVLVEQQVKTNKVYTFASNQIGSDVNRFQSNKAKAIKQLNKENGISDSQSYYAEDTIRRKMAENNYKISSREYRDLDAALVTWRKTSWATELEWDDGEEKRTGKYQPSVMTDPFENASLKSIESRNGFQRAIIHAGILANDAMTAVRLLRLIDDVDSIAGLNDLDVNDDFRQALWSCCSSFIAV